MAATTYPNYSPGLEGVIAGITRISEIDVEHSKLTYRGYDAHDLATKGAFEETAYLLLYGELPNAAQLKDFKKTLGAERTVPNEIYEILARMPKKTHPMDLVKVGFAALAPHDPDYTASPTDHDANVRKAVRIAAKAGTMVANAHHIRKGEPTVAPDPSLGIAGNFLHILFGGKSADRAPRTAQNEPRTADRAPRTEGPDPFTQKVLDTSMTLYAEHGFNASTFACRVTVATLSDIYSGIVSGIGTLKGALHGGANEEAMKMLLEIDGTQSAVRGDSDSANRAPHTADREPRTDDRTPRTDDREPRTDDRTPRTAHRAPHSDTSKAKENARAWVLDALATKKKIMGFGHREYKKGDSRVPIMKRLAREIGERKGDLKWVEIAEVVERTMMEEKGIIPNVDFPSSYAYYQLGIPIDLYTPIFVMARVTGWSAHAIEQLDNNRLIRPAAIYEGPGLRPWVPVEKR